MAAKKQLQSMHAFSSKQNEMRVSRLCKKSVVICFDLQSAGAKRCRRESAKTPPPLILIAAPESDVIFAPSNSFSRLERRNWLKGAGSSSATHGSEESIFSRLARKDSRARMEIQEDLRNKLRQFIYAVSQSIKSLSDCHVKSYAPE
jgi:hypothetical protein